MNSCAYEKLEDMPACLLVVDELAFGDASETRHAEQALRVMRHEAICFPEEHDGGVEQPAMLNQVESEQQGFGVTRAGLFHASAADGLVHRARDFGVIQIVDAELIGRLAFPALRGVHLFEQQPAILLLRHDDRRGSLPHVGSPVVGVGASPFKVGRFLARSGRFTSSGKP